MPTYKNFGLPRMGRKKSKSEGKAKPTTASTASTLSLSRNNNILLENKSDTSPSFPIKGMEKLQLSVDTNAGVYHPETSASANSTYSKCYHCKVEMKHFQECLSIRPRKPRTYYEAIQAQIGARRRIEEIIQGRGNLEYYSWVAKNIRRDAEENEDYMDYSEPFDQFENFFNSLGPMPAAFKCVLDYEKAKLLQPQDLSDGAQSECSECDGVQGDISFMLRSVALSEKPFVSEEEWCVRKLCFEPSKVTTDCKFLDNMVESSIRLLKEKPTNFEVYIAKFIQAYEDVGVPVSEYFQEVVSLIKDFVRNGEVEMCEPYMRELSQMMMTRWKVSAVRIPPKLLKEGEEANRRHKAREAKEKAAAQWKVDLDNFMASDRPSTDKNMTDLNAPFAPSKNQPKDFEDEMDAKLSPQQLEILRRNSFVEKLRKFILKATEAKKIGDQMPPNAEYADTIRKWSKIETERANNALLGAKAIAEARGWVDVVEDIKIAIQTAEKGNNKMKCDGDEADSKRHSEPTGPKNKQSCEVM